MRLWDELLAGGETALQFWLKERVYEDVDLEFKEKSNADHGGFEKPDSRNLGKTLSAFANSAGGLLLFGAKARKVAEVDCLAELKPIHGYEAFASEARRLCAQYLLPTHDGIEVRPLISNVFPERGYVAIRVERSERRPHMSRAPDDHRYYKRSGDNTLIMEHFDVEDAFARGSAPALEVFYTLENGGSGTTGPLGMHYEVTILVGLRVRSGTARAPFLHLEHPAVAAIMDWSRYQHRRHPLRMWNAGSVARYEGSGVDVFHEGVDYPLAVLQATISAHGNVGRLMLGDTPAEEASIQIAFRHGAEGTRTTSGMVRIPARELVRALGMEARLPTAAGGE